MSRQVVARGSFYSFKILNWIKTYYFTVIAYAAHTEHNWLTGGAFLFINLKNSVYMMPTPQWLNNDFDGLDACGSTV